MAIRKLLKSCLQNRYLTLPWGRQSILLEYAVNPQSRYGHGKPVHAGLDELIASRMLEYDDLLHSFLRFQSDLLRIPRDAPAGSAEPSWTCDFFSGIDAVALYCLLRARRPAQFVEIGSGESTKVARRAISDGGLATRVTSIDPCPRKQIDGLCDRVIRSGLEECDLGIFAELKPGDFVFVDSSHRCFTNSDVTVFFLDVLPRLPSGTVVHFHDIFLPEDYPLRLAQRFYSEQYLLAAHLLADPEKSQILLPSRFLCCHPASLEILSPLWNAPPLRAAKRGGSSFWFMQN